jgi:hypothetical protein
MHLDACRYCRCEDQSGNCCAVHQRTPSVSSMAVSCILYVTLPGHRVAIPPRSTADIF